MQAVLAPAHTDFEGSSFSTLLVFPTLPGQGMDVELFLKMKARLKKVVVDQMGTAASATDDAAALMVGFTGRLIGPRGFAFFKRKGKTGNAVLTSKTGFAFAYLHMRKLIFLPCSSSSCRHRFLQEIQQFNIPYQTR